MTLHHNPLLVRSDLPYQLPRWEEIKPKHIVPAVTEALRQEREAWNQIVNEIAAPTVENTVEALNTAGRTRAEVLNIAYTLFGSIGGSELEAAESEIGPLLAAHSNAYLLDKRIYDRLAALDLSDVDEETRHWVTEELATFRRSGIDLDEQDKARLRELDAALSEAEITFGQRATAAMTDNEPVFTDAAQLAGLADTKLAAAKQPDGSWRLPLDNYSSQSLLAELTLPETRRRLLEASLTRGLGDAPASDTRELILKIARLRAERAELLGYQHHAQAVTEAGMAKDADSVLELLTMVAGTAFRAAKQEAETIMDLAARDGITELDAADWPYYEAKQRAALGINVAELAPYFELWNVVENGIFFAANRLYGVRFEPRPDLKGYLPSVRTWEVLDADGSPVALFQADFFRRKGKHGGAWMNPVVDGCELDGNLPVIMNNCNYAEPAAGKPCLLSWDDIITLFHEFGHALHGIFTKTRYRATSGTNTARDFVEAPSQFNEMWATHPEVVANYAVHYETGEKLNPETVSTLVAAANLGQAYGTAEQLAAALLDQAWHRLGSAEIPTDVEEFERQVLARFGILYELIPPRYRSAYFTHTFGGGYDAGYYSYTWAEVMAAEIEEWFRTAGALNGDGGLNLRAGTKVRQELLSRGSSRPEMESVLAVIGKQPDPHAVLRRRGITA